MAEAAEPTIRAMTVSILFFRETERVRNLLDSISAWLVAFGETQGINVTIAVRNNNPVLDDFSVAETIRELAEQNSEMEYRYFTQGPNIGFGRGHNENFVACPSDIFFILNDDIGFPSLDWLDKAIDMFRSDSNLAALGASDNPRLLNPMFGNGEFDRRGQLYPLSYAEASVLLIRSDAFKSVGMFDDQIEWAMSEDADLSLKLQSAGYRIDWIDMPHEHWRSSSFNSVPDSVRSSILEHNRARIFARWNDSLSTGKVGQHLAYDIYSDGIGDVFCALLHLASHLKTLPPKMRRQVLVNCSSPELARFILPNDVQVITIRDVAELRERYGGGLAALLSTRSLNYSLPYDIHTLLAASLSIPRAAPQELRELWSANGHRLPAGVTPMTGREPYCVVHLESFRTEHDGRSVDDETSERILAQAALIFPKLVLVGQERKPYGADFDNILDLRGATSLLELATIVSRASHFIGLDSLPAHIAQVASVPAAIIFGSVHPCARVLEEPLVWPIVAKLDCIGCYHSHISPSIPFCMRRDIACVREALLTEVAVTLRALQMNREFSWHALRTQFANLQSKHVHLLLHHPADAGTFVKSNLPHERVTRTIYRILEEVSDLTSLSLAPSYLSKLKADLSEGQATGWRQRAEVKKLQRELDALQKEVVGLRSAAAPIIELDLFEYIDSLKDCEITEDRGRILVTSSGDDPQIRFRPIYPISDRCLVKVSVSSSSSGRTAQLYWALGDEVFDELRSLKRPLETKPRLIVAPIDASTGKAIRLRFDPSDVASVTSFSAKVSWLS